VKYSLFVPRPDLQDIPEHCFFMTYELAESDESLLYWCAKNDPRPSLPDESSIANDGPDVLSSSERIG
jgi:hypothetical protein